MIAVLGRREAWPGLSRQPRRNLSAYAVRLAAGSGERFLGRPCSRSAGDHLRPDPSLVALVACWSTWYSRSHQSSSWGILEMDVGSTALGEGLDHSWALDSDVPHDSGRPSR